MFSGIQDQSRSAKELCNLVPAKTAVTFVGDSLLYQFYTSLRARVAHANGPSGCIDAKQVYDKVILVTHPPKKS